MREPGDTPQPQELPGQAPEEVPVRGPDGPGAPNPAIAKQPAGAPVRA